VARPETIEGICYFVISLEDKVELEIIELLQLPNVLPVCRHVGVMTVRLPHDLVDDELKVTADIKLLNPKLDDNTLTIDEWLIFCHIVGCAEMQLNHVEEPIFLRRDQHHASPSPVEDERAIESPFCDPPRGETVFDNFPEPIQHYHMDQVALKIIQELVLYN
jgi:hypothetical protein